MRVHQDWASASFEAASPVARETSVFPRRGFLETWWNHFGTGTLHLVEDGSSLVALERLEDGTICFVGDEDLTDYHSPLGPGSGSLLAEFLADQPAGTRFRLDSLPGEAAEAIEPFLTGPVRQVHETAQRMELPGGFDEWLAGLRKKERHELRRKHRRFSETLGRPRLIEVDDPIGTFTRMHRMADGPKGRFMTPEREAFFRDLATLPGARVDILAGAAGFPAAAAFGFQDDEVYALYNSAYDPSHAHASPGIVLLWFLVESVVEARLPIFDFLKGDETYKLRLGAAARPLYVLEGTT